MDWINIDKVEALKDAAHFSSFAQRVKMAYWDTLTEKETPVGSHVSEKDLDTILLLAWEDVKSVYTNQNETIRNTKKL